MLQLNPDAYQSSGFLRRTEFRYEIGLMRREVIEQYYYAYRGTYYIACIWSITVDGKDFVGVTLEDSC